MFPTPHNPDNLDATPGYRFLGIDETLKTTDEAWWNKLGKWKKTVYPGKTPASTRSTTYRRALSADDPFAPPPTEWTNPFYTVFCGENAIGPNPKETQVWSPAPVARWIESGEAFSPNFYYRHPITSMNTIQLAPQTDWIPFVTRVPTNQECSNGVWVSGSTVKTLHYTKHIDLSWWNKTYTHWRLALPPPPPKNVVPKVNGYEMTYVKGEKIVTFGCAKIDVKLLREADTFMHIPFGDQQGNRIARGIILSSGVEITTTQIAEILSYVEAINGG